MLFTVVGLIRALSTEGLSGPSRVDTNHRVTLRRRRRRFKGENDLDEVGCCTAAPGYDTASGIGVPNWATLPGTLPAPA
jgi:hypothetical protein